jgi:hypothetical protein
MGLRSSNALITLGPGDLLAHHAIALGLHLSILILMGNKQPFLAHTRDI